MLEKEIEYNLWREAIKKHFLREYKELMCLPISSKRSTHTTNTFVSGPSGGKDFPVDDLFVFTKGLSYRNPNTDASLSKQKKSSSVLSAYGSDTLT